MKIKISNKDLNECIKSVLFDKNTILEGSEVDKEDVKSIVKKELKSLLGVIDAKDLTSKVEAMVLQAIKTNKDLEKHYVEISKNVLVQLYKNLWTRRSFWSSDLKNSAN